MYLQRLILIVIFLLGGTFKKNQQQTSATTISMKKASKKAILEPVAPPPSRQTLPIVAPDSWRPLPAQFAYSGGGHQASFVPPPTGKPGVVYPAVE